MLIQIYTRKSPGDSPKQLSTLDCEVTKQLIHGEWTYELKVKKSELNSVIDAEEYAMFLDSLLALVANNFESEFPAVIKVLIVSRIRPYKLQILNYRRYWPSL